jgi:hypothetical protein
MAVLTATVTAASIKLPALAAARSQLPSAALLAATGAAAAVIVLVIAATAARSRLGRRVLLLLAIPGCILPAGLVRVWPASPAAAILGYLPPVELAALAIAAARRSAQPDTDPGRVTPL